MFDYQKIFKDVEEPSYIEVRLRRLKGALYSALDSTLAMSDVYMTCLADRKKVKGQKFRITQASQKLAGPSSDETNCAIAKKEECEEEEEYVLGIPMHIPVYAASGLFTIITAWASVAGKALCNFEGVPLKSILQIPLKGSSVFPFTSFATAEGTATVGGATELIKSELKTHIEVLSLTSAMMFIGSLRGLNSHKTAHEGNYLGMAAAGLGILSVVASSGFGGNYARFFSTFFAGGAIGLGVAEIVKMEDMPQLVAGFHSFVGIAAVLVGFANLFAAAGTPLVGVKALETFLGVAIGSLTMTGSFAAAAKLHGIIPGRPIVPPFRWALNGLGLLASIALGVLFCEPSLIGMPWFQPYLLLINTAIWGALGVNMILPIGGADMPVIVSMLNSFSGLSTAAAGFMLGNDLLTISGALIASSGALLSDIMCRGINRSLISVLLGGFGTGDGTILDQDGAEAGTVLELSHNTLVDKMFRSRRIIIVPGYGMAVSRCQQKLRDVMELLRSRGITVHFAIHPVAGRMPGHMNVLLAEAKVPLDAVREMDDVNADIRSNKYDFAIVIGANDIVNPDTATNQSSPIFGMPAIEVWKCKECVILKRSMATGYSGVDNPLFYLQNSRMLFGDAKRSMETLYTLIEERPPMAMGQIEEDEEEEEEVEVIYPEPTKTLGVLKETEDMELRVAVSPGLISKLRLLGYTVVVEFGAGEGSGFTNADYVNQGAEIHSKADVLKISDTVVKVNGPTLDEVQMLRPNSKFIGSWSMMGADDLTNGLVKHQKTAFNMELVPRISRAQKLDMITSMANIAGYRAVLDGFNHLPRFSRTGVTASGTIPAAKVFIIGAGVAGLSAIATAVGLGAKVYASDVRTAARDQVESLGAEFLDVPTPIEGEGQDGYAAEQKEEILEQQRKLYAKMCKESDIVITTAMIPHKPAPLIITEAMVDGMKPHSVIVDLAAKRGGNCALTVPDQIIVHRTKSRPASSTTDNLVDESGATISASAHSGVTIIGHTNYPSAMAQTASDLLAQNYLAMLEVLGTGELDMEDQIIRSTCITLEGDLKYPPPKPRVSFSVDLEERISIPSLPRTSSSIEKTPETVRMVIKWLESHKEELAMGLGLGVITALGLTTTIPTEEVTHLGYFCLSLLIGNFTVASVTPSLHTPLISVTNAISGIIIVGGMLQLSGPILSAKVVSALLAVFFSSINIVGGFAVTQRMLNMFELKDGSVDEDENA